MREKILEYFNGDSLASDVFLSKYSLNKEESPDDMHKRLAKEFARIEWYYLSELDKSDDENVFSKLSTYGRKRIKELLSEGVTQETINQRTYEMFKDFKYIVPGGSVMEGLGSERPVSLSNCFVIASPNDSIEDILETARDAAQIYKRRGGVGIDISLLRPNGSTVNNAAHTSTGAVSFMDLYSKITEIIGQSGRRGALMITLDVNHPDVFEFATVKRDLTKVTGANISIKLNNKFLNAVENNEDYILRYPYYISDNLISEIFEADNIEEVQKSLTYNKLYKKENYINSVIYVKKIKAKELWNTIIESAHQSAEPGIFNWDKLINYDPTGVYNKLKPISTNPCGELGLSAYDSCRLLCTNLYSLVEKPFLINAAIDSQKAYEIFYEAQILADNLVDLELEAIDKILLKIEPGYKKHLNSYKDIDYKWYSQKASEEFKLWWKIKRVGDAGRRTGTGITAYADMLAAMDLPYGDKTITENIFKIKFQAELDASIDLAILRGSFPLWDPKAEFTRNDEGELKGGNEWYNYLLKEFPLQSIRMIEYGRRNAGLSTVAPTGSISILTQTSSGIEPIFKAYYTRRVKCNSGETPDVIDNGIGYKEYTYTHPKFEEWYKQYCKENGFKYTPLNQLDKEEVQEYFEISPYFEQNSGDIDYQIRIETQALIQKYITSSISSTVNLDKDTSKEIIGDLYLYAFDSGCKGVTVYREGSRGGILISDNSKKEQFKYHNAPKRPTELEAYLHITKNRGNTYAVVVGLLEDKPYEVFVFNTCGTKYSEGKGKITKVAKGHYRFESDKLTIDNLNDSGNSELEKAAALYTSMLLRHGANVHYVIKTAKKINDGITSFVSAMSRVLNKYNTVKEEGECPECGGKLIKEAGCERCIDCGVSKCN